MDLQVCTWTTLDISKWKLFIMDIFIYEGQPKWYETWDMWHVLPFGLSLVKGITCFWSFSAFCVGQYGWLQLFNLYLWHFKLLREAKIGVSFQSTWNKVGDSKATQGVLWLSKSLNSILSGSGPTVCPVLHTSNVRNFIWALMYEAMGKPLVPSQQRVMHTA